MHPFVQCIYGLTFVSTDIRFGFLSDYVYDVSADSTKSPKACQSVMKPTHAFHLCAANDLLACSLCSLC